MCEPGLTAKTLRCRNAALTVILCLSILAARPGFTAENTPTVDPHTVGCILPLSGRNAAYGHRALDALLLAAGVFNMAKQTPLRVLIEDSRSDAAVAGAAVEKLARAGVPCILGPLGSQEAWEAAKEAQRLRIPILTLTQREGITGFGDQVFRNFLTPAMQVRTVVQYAQAEWGLRRFATLYPDDPYGQEMSRLFREEVQRKGGEIRKEIPYKVDQTDFGAEILALLGGGSPVSPGMEVAAGAAAKTDPGFEALFIPDLSQRVAMIVPQLAYYDLTGIRLLGTSGWNSPALLGADPRHLQRSVFVDGFFSASYRPEVNDFIDAFYSAYGREPATMEALVYDAADILVRLLLENRGITREDFRNGLARIKDYPGVSGKTTFPISRDAEKDLFILTVKDDRIMEVR